MCGISGIISWDQIVEADQINEMNNYLSNRGPDNSGVFLDKNIGMGHTRLSIQDLSSNGNQPMRIKGTVISYNGEIFNFKELRSELKELGYSFNSGTDTEVIVNLYNHYGISFISKLNGMFAIAIYDQKKEKLYLIRDRYGIKPLYLYTDDNKFIFSSDLKSIVRNKLSKVTLDNNAIKDYLFFHYIRNPRTPYNEITKIQAGSYCTINISNQRLKTYQYYEIDSNNVNHDQSQNEIIENIDSLLNDSISKRMISDLEVGAFLSGGVDSSIVTAIASKYSSHKLQTFSIGYKGLSDYFDETEYALQVSKKFNTQHHVLSLDFDKTFNELEEIIYELDEPIADTSVFLNYYLSKLTKEHVTVALSGLGADELFGGYNRYQALAYENNLRKFPKSIKAIKNLMQLIPENRVSNIGNKIRQAKKLLSSIDGSMEDNYINMISYNTVDIDNSISIDDKDSLNSVLKYDIKYYMNDNLLNLSDKMSMASSLEMRVPFLDYRLVNYSMTIDQKFKTNIYQKKIILKKLAEKYLDKNLIYRRKQGFSAPIEIWMKKRGKLYIESLINFNFLERFVNTDIINNDIEEFFDRNRDKSLQIYSYIVISIWYKLNKSFIYE